MKEAIQKAMEGGYELRDMEGDFLEIEDLDMEREWYVVASDSSFWRCLGKAMGWPKISAYPRESDNEHETWKMTWHLFIEHLAEGKDVESFFNNLLGEK